MTATLLVFSAPWCAPCKALAPVLVELEQKLTGKLVVQKVNVDDEPELAEKFKVTSVPTLVVLNPEEVKRIVGAKSLSMLEEMIGAVL